LDHPELFENTRKKLGELVEMDLHHECCNFTIIVTLPKTGKESVRISENIATWNIYAWENTFWTV
jgi:hypothetical protein